MQANLGLRRAAQCERCLGLASMLAMKEPNMTTNTMRSQLSRLYGQLYALQVGHGVSLVHWAAVCVAVTTAAPGQAALAVLISSMLMSCCS